MKKPDSKFTTLRFVFIAVVLMLLADTYIFGGKRSYIEEAKQSYREEQARVQAEEIIPAEEVPVVVEPDNGAEFFEDIPEGPAEDVPAAEPDVKVDHPPEAALPPVTMPGPFKGKAKVAIIIDDLGMDAKRSREIVDLPAPITLAFLPYGTKTVELAKIGKARGHELIIHTPMQAVDTKQNIGPMGLKANMDQATFDSSFKTIMQSFDGYDGINNHMGSLLTQDETAMGRLMVHLKANNLFFVDSRTINKSVAARKAREAGVPYAVRDVFLDHENTRGFVDNALLQVERKALRDGSAIAIGHPKDVTIAGLKAWLPTLASKGIEVVPVRQLLIKPAGVTVRTALEPIRTEAAPSVQPSTDMPDVIVEEAQDDVVIEGQDGVAERVVIEPEISPDVLNAFEGGTAPTAQLPQQQPEQLPAIY